MGGLIEGRIVHYIQPDRVERHVAFGVPSEEVDNPLAGHHEAALVTGIVDAERGVCTLFAFGHDGRPTIRTDIPYSEGKEGGTWHWIERA